jgi:hypothetical protein
MTALQEIAFSLGKRDDVPNQLLAKKLSDKSDTAGIQELVEHLHDKNSNIASDCLKTLYEVGVIQPALIEKYAREFLKLLTSPNNRMVWGAMITLSTIAARQADTLYPHIDLIMKTTQTGSVITTDNGIKTLALIGAANPDYRNAVFPFLLDHLRTCRPKEVPQHAESTLPAVDTVNRQAFTEVLEKRMEDLNPGGLLRIKKVIKAAEKLMD